ncbi:MAG: UDP-N-acetylglucosamine 1-carboxyvinyltransferase [Clostridia bacterium]|nr:UDP-N-acetylglucosamine 1-carboxyvinyltransferase [Clostridia bacterium]
MEQLVLEGGRRLGGAVTVHGAKNSALPLLAATLLAEGTSELHNCPRLSDVEVATRILSHLGCGVTVEDHTVTVNAKNVCRGDIPDGLMREMRSSIVFLGAILARVGEATLSFPGGCELGPRPIDLHLSALARLGAQIHEESGHLCCRAPKGLAGAAITLPFPSVGATENVLLAAATAKGTTVLRNAAREPEIADLCAFLNACGARIHGGGESTLTVEGVEHLSGCCHRVIPDRIEAATYMAAAAATGGTLVLKNIEPEHLMPVFPAFEEAGCRLTPWGEELLVSTPTRPRRVRGVRTMPYPGFPTDGAAPLLALCCVAEGTSVFVETIFESRYKYAAELCRMGACIKVEGRVAVVEGVPVLSGAPVSCTDLRGGAALVVAALAAEGITHIGELHHLDRGYERLEDTLAGVGASIKRIQIS